MNTPKYATPATKNTYPFTPMSPLQSDWLDNAPSFVASSANLPVDEKTASLRELYSRELTKYASTFRASSSSTASAPWRGWLRVARCEAFFRQSLNGVMLDPNNYLNGQLRYRRFCVSNPPFAGFAASDIIAHMIFTVFMEILYVFYE